MQISAQMRRALSYSAVFSSCQGNAKKKKMHAIVALSCCIKVMGVSLLSQLRSDLDGPAWVGLDVNQREQQQPSESGVELTRPRSGPARLKNSPVRKVIFIIELVFMELH